jgi:cellulose synthase/poly-beta-1,6-N-acetylglucosamine synthase-like glycosyltransferase
MANGSTKRDRILGYTVEWRRQKDKAWLPVFWYLYFIVALPYITWRITIINWDSWGGLVMYLAELYGVFTTGLFLFVSKKIFIPIKNPMLRKTSVDVLIPTYTESLDILEPVVIGALKIRGVGKVLVLDDGDRPIVRGMAKRLGVGYHARKDNFHAKAGNMNNGLQHSNAEFFITLDADHIPLPFFIEETLGFFEDPKVAFVQSPQTFYNDSAFLFCKRAKKMDWGEQIMFYNCLQPAKNNWNAAFFVGTSAILRRSAIDELGGFATGTATEDIHTSLKLHAKGWQSVFLPKPLAYGLEAENFKEFYKQRRRWAAGSLGLLFRSPDSPLRANGLTLSQRLNYLSACLAHLQGLQKICFLMVPIIAIFTNTAPVRGSLALFTAFFGFYLTVALSATWAYSRGTYHLIFTEMFAVSNIMAHLGGLKGIIKVQKKFAVSRKSSLRRDGKLLNLGMWGLGLLTIAAICRGGITYLIYHKEASLVLSCTIFVSINGLLLISFLLKLRTYENDKTMAAYESMNPMAKYNYVILNNAEHTT